MLNFNKNLTMELVNKPRMVIPAISLHVSFKLCSEKALSLLPEI